jgi:hypothetical protein
VHAHANALPASPLHPEDVGGEKDLDLFAREDVPDFVGDVRVLATQELRPVLDKGHAAAEAAVGLGKFEADIPAAEDDKVLGHPPEFEALDVRERSGLGQARDGWDRGVGPQIEEDPVAGQDTGAAVVQPYLERLLGDEAPGAHDQFGPARLVVVQVQADQAVDHVVLALPQISFLLGRQAMLGQEPPIQRHSTTAVRRPDRARCQARSLPPAPQRQASHQRAIDGELVSLVHRYSTSVCPR